MSPPVGLMANAAFASGVVDSIGGGRGSVRNSQFRMTKISSCMNV